MKRFIIFTACFAWFATVAIAADWGRDPFRFDDAPPVKTESVAANPVPVVTMIVAGHGGKMALVNGKKVTMGDSVGDAVVRDIDMNGVVVEKKGVVEVYKIRGGAGR